MRPARLRLVAEFPVTRTGKVDRLALRALPEIAPATPPGSPAEGEQPANETEAAVARIFARILEIPEPGRHDDFFALGGTSLTLAQLQTELRNEGIGEIDLAAVVKSATVADIAATATRRADITGTDLIVALRPTGDAAPLFLIHGWHGQAFVTRSFLESVPEQHPVYSIRARGFDGVAKPHRSVRAMADEYLAAIATVAHPVPPIIGGICAGGSIALEMAAHVKRSGGPSLQVILFDPPFPGYARPVWARIADLTAFYLALTPVRFGRTKSITNRMVRRLDARARRIGMDAVDPARLDNDVAIRVAVSIGIAMRKHRPSIYDGPVHLIASKKTTRAEKHYRKIVTRPFERLVVGDQHADVLSPGNLAFRDAMRRVMASLEAGSG